MMKTEMVEEESGESFEEMKTYKSEGLRHWINRFCIADWNFEPRDEKTSEDYVAYFDLIAPLYNDFYAFLKKVHLWPSLYDHRVKEVKSRVRKMILECVNEAKGKFQNDFELWEYLVSFLEQVGWYEEVSLTYREITEHFGPTHSQVYIAASTYEYECNLINGYGMDLARKIIAQGLRHHNCDLKLRLHTIWLECVFAQYQIDASENDKQMRKICVVGGETYVPGLLNLKTAFKRSTLACKKKYGVRYYAKVYQTVNLERFEFIHRFLDEVLADARREYPDIEKEFDVLARGALLEFNAMDDEPDIPSLMNSIRIYEEGLSLSPTIKMYENYLRTLGQARALATEKYLLDLLKDKMIEVYTSAHDHQAITADMYNAWYVFARHFENQYKLFGPEPRKWQKPRYNSPVILYMGLEHYPHNWKLLSHRIKDIIREGYYDQNHKRMGKMNRDKFLDLYEAIVDPKGESGGLWKIGYFYLLRASDIYNDTITEFIDLAPNPVKLVLSKWFMKELFKLSREEEAFDLYCLVQYSPGFTGNLHLEFANHLAAFVIPATEDTEEKRHTTIAKFYDESLKNFGATSLEAWTSYIKFEIANKPKVSQLIHKALLTLTPDLQTELMEKVTFSYEN